MWPGIAFEECSKRHVFEASPIRRMAVGLETNEGIDGCVAQLPAAHCRIGLLERHCGVGKPDEILRHDLGTLREHGRLHTSARSFAHGVESGLQQRAACQSCGMVSPEGCVCAFEVGQPRVGALARHGPHPTAVNGGRRMVTRAETSSAWNRRSGT